MTCYRESNLQVYAQHMSFARQANASLQRLVVYLSRLAHCLTSCANACNDLAHGNQVVNAVQMCEAEPRCYPAFNI